MKYSAIIIGSGFSGVCMGIKLKEKGINDFIILEKAQSEGGTWRENTYPGAECDIPSALYSYSFEPYPEWEYKWSLQPQILDYITMVVDKYDLRKHIIFEKELTSAIWDDINSQWKISTKCKNEYYAQSFIPAIGQLHHPSTPNFIGKDTYNGPTFHSAQWDHSVPLEDKSVGVIGNAASAVQFIPEIAKVAKKVKIFQRSPNWMLPKQDRAYKNWEKNLVRRFPLLLKLYRLRIWLLGGALFNLMKQGNAPLRKFYQWQCKRFIQKHIKDPKKVSALIPSYPLGAKRVLFSDTYYPALATDNVDLFTGGVNKITTEGVITGENKHEKVDVLIYATGFKTNPFLLGLDIRGKEGISIREAWKVAPEAHLGISVHQFPNLFMMYGPNTNLGHNSIILMSEAQAGYISHCIASMQKKNWNSVNVKKDIMKKYHQQVQQKLKNMIWSSIDNSWYKSANGSIPNNYHGRTMEYMSATKTVNFDDFEISL